MKLVEKLRKIASMILAMSFVVSAPFSAFCAGSTAEDKKTMEASKPLKRKRPKVKGELKEKHLVEVGKYFKEYKDFANLSCVNKKYRNVTEKYSFNPIEICNRIDAANFKNINTYRIYAGQKFNLDLNVNKQIFEVGTFGIDKFKKMLENNGIGPNEKVWKKEVFPLGDGEVNDTSTFPMGIKLVLTNRNTGKQIIFLFEFGNLSLIWSFQKEYSFKSEYSHYIQFMSVIRKLKPENPEKIKIRIDYEDIKKVVIPFKVRDVRDNSFECNTQLELVEFGKDINSIGASAFECCKNLKHVIFKGEVKGIEKEAFANCFTLEEIKFPEGLTFIGCGCFKNCRSLQRVFIPSTLEMIYPNAFDSTQPGLRIFYCGREYSVNDFFEAFTAKGGYVKY